jgi:hypothetical protein
VSATPPKTNGASRRAAAAVRLPGHPSVTGPDRPVATAGPGRAPGLEAGRLQRHLAALLLSFGAVALIDLLVVSLLTGRLRVWFPLWLDPQWDARPEPWIVGSHSYLAGLALLPALLRLLDRELLKTRGALPRATFYASSLTLLALLAWWQTDLIVASDAGREALGWLLLTALLYTLVRLALALPARLGVWDRRALLRGLATTLALLFLLMALADLVLQLGVHGLPWSAGLLVELAVFVPAGVTLLWLRRRLGASPPR